MLNRLFFYLCFTFLFACASENSPDEDPDTSNNPLNNASTNVSKTAEFKVIEYIADLSANSTSLEGVWESRCTPNKDDVNYFIKRRVYHLNGVFKEILIFNDPNCTTKNSQNTLRLFGTFDVVEKKNIFNGTDDVEINFLEVDYLSAPLTGRPISINQLTKDDLTAYNSETETSKVIANRLYVSKITNPDLSDLLDDNENYLINAAIDIKTVTEDEIDQQAFEILK